METNKDWKGYQENFLDGFIIHFPKIKEQFEEDIAENLITKEKVFKFIYYSSVHSKSRKMPFYTASNISREYWLSNSREGTFVTDDRLSKDEQLSTDIYTQLNKKHEEKNKKVDKGHLTRREDVQWDESKNDEQAIEAAKATFFYTNACPQHHQLNNEIWKYLEDSVLARGRSKKPLKAIVFTGPIFDKTDPLLVFPLGITYKIKCPIRFWKVIYYVNDSNELRCAAFIMSHKDLMERDGHIETESTRGEKAILEKVEKPFLNFEENEKYQITLSLLSKLTDLTFYEAKEGLTEEQLYSKLIEKPKEMTRGLELFQKSFNQNHEDTIPIEIGGLYL